MKHIQDYIAANRTEVISLRRQSAFFAAGRLPGWEAQAIGIEDRITELNNLSILVAREALDQRKSPPA